MAYTPVPSAAGGVAVGTALSGGTASRFITTDENGLVETDSAFTTDVNDNVGFGGAVDTSYRVKVRQATGGAGLQTLAAVGADTATINCQSSAGRFAALQSYGDTAGGTVGGASPNSWAHVSGFNTSGLLIGSTDGVPTKFVAGNNADRGAAGGLLSSNSTAVGNVGAGEDTLQSYSVKASTLNTNEHSVWMSCRVLFAANANSKQVRVKFGATTLYDSTAQVQNGGVMYVFARVIRTGAATQIAEGYVLNTAGTPLFTDDAFSAAPTETLSGAVAFLITGEAVDNNDITATARWGWDSA